MKFQIALKRNSEVKAIEYDYAQQESNERPMALDVLLAAQETECSGLAYRYGCRNGLCGVCTIDVNGKAKLACRTKLREGDTLSAMHSLPAIRDLVVRRDKINQQLLGRLPIVESSQEKLAEDHSAQVSLNRCIECYACLNGCPVHDKNELEKDAEYRYGNPYSFLKIQRVLVNPNASAEEKERALALAMSLGIMEYEEKKVPGCGVGIDLKKEVILPLIEQCKAHSLLEKQTEDAQ